MTLNPTSDDANLVILLLASGLHNAMMANHGEQLDPVSDSTKWKLGQS